GTGVAETAGAAAQLVVDTPRLVTFGVDDVQPAQRADGLLVTLDLMPFLGQHAHPRFVDRSRRILAVLEHVDRLVPVALTDGGQVELRPSQLLARQTLGVAAQADVDTATGHVRRNRYGAGTAGLGDD